MDPLPNSRPPTPNPLWDAAVAVLRANDVGGWTRPAPRLYPHQWSWDSAFVAIGLAHVDPARALLELESLFAAQWSDGRVPHIVYNQAAPPGEYFPNPERWACAALSAAAPTSVATSGLIQPPVHALAAWRICELITQNGQVTHPDLLPRLRALYPKLFAWHRYLATARDPDGSGLLTIYHPWESGTDNSPRWDAPLANVVVGQVPPYTRRDLQHVSDPACRPSDAEYDRYLWLVECLKRARYDDAEIHRTHPFLVKDVLSSAIFAAANDALLRLKGWLDWHEAELAGTEPPTYVEGGVQVAQLPSDAREVNAWADAAADAFERLLIEHRRETYRYGYPTRLICDVDVRADRYIPTRTCAGFAALLIPPRLSLFPRHAGHELRGLVDDIFGPEFAGAAGLRFRVLPSAAIRSPGFNARSYWRGPAWPFVNWLVWWGLRRWEASSPGFPKRASALHAANLALLARPEARFAEYFDPFTAGPLGSLDQSWTAAVTLDWLAAQD